MRRVGPCAARSEQADEPSLYVRLIPPGTQPTRPRVGHRPTGTPPTLPAVPHQQIANGIAQVYKDLYGRGPQKIVATILPDSVFVTLEDVNTPGQNKLLQVGEIRLLDTVHSRLQRSIEPDLIAVVESVLDRKVRSYIPGYNGRDNVATDAFLLEHRTD